MARNGDFWAWWGEQDASLRLWLTAALTCLGGSIFFRMFPNIGAVLTVTYAAYLLGVGIEFFLIRKDGPFVRSGAGTALRKDQTFLVVLAVVFLVPVMVTLTVGLPDLLHWFEAAYANGWLSFLTVGIIAIVTAVQVEYMYE